VISCVLNPLLTTVPSLDQIGRGGLPPVGA